MIEKNFVMEDHIPEIAYYEKCGHYSCDDGQHRVCIAGKMGIEIQMAKPYTIENVKCPVCTNGKYFDCTCFFIKF